MCQSVSRFVGSFWSRTNRNANFSDKQAPPISRLFVLIMQEEEVLGRKLSSSTDTRPARSPLSQTTTATNLITQKSAKANGDLKQWIIINLGWKRKLAVRRAQPGDSPNEYQFAMAKWLIRLWLSQNRIGQIYFKLVQFVPGRTLNAGRLNEKLKFPSEAVLQFYYCKAT